MTSQTSATRAAQLARIRGLMAKTVDNGCTEAEAAAAAAAVDRLMEQYEIDLDEVTVREQPIGGGMPVKVGARHAVLGAALRIARFTDCQVWNNDGLLVYFGFKVDVEIAEYLTLVFKRAIDREVAAVQLFNPDYTARSATEQQAYTHDFGRGMANRLGERLTELKSKRDLTQRGTGRDLVALKLPLVDKALRAAGIKLGKPRRGAKVRDKSAWHAGRTAGDSVAINAGIAGRAAQGGMLR